MANNRVRGLCTADFGDVLFFVAAAALLFAVLASWNEMLAVVHSPEPRTRPAAGVDRRVATSDPAR